MREAEIAALCDEFFENTFTERSATLLLGAESSTDDLEDRRVTYIRPHARTLSRAEVHTILPSEPDGVPMVEDLVLVMSGERSYSRAALETLLGPGRKVSGPLGEDGQPSWQVEFDVDRSISGTVALRWFEIDGDSAEMGDPDGPDAFRADEIQLHRWLDETPREGDPSGAGHDTVPPDFDGEIPDDRAFVPHPVNTEPPAGVSPSMRPPEREVSPELIDAAMEVGAWVGDLIWRILRPDFSMARALELFDGPPSSESDDTKLVIEPSDPRLELATIHLRGEEVTEVRIEMGLISPLILAIDSVADRLNAQPLEQPGEITFQFESARWRGSVSLILARARSLGEGLASINVIEVSREG